MAKLSRATPSFPIRGRGGRARQNRALLAALGVAGTGAGLVALAAYGRGGLTPLLRPSGYVYKNLPEGIRITTTSPFLSMRPAETLAEKAWLKVPGIGRLLGKEGEVYGIPLSARGRVWLSRQAKEKAASAIERASLWKVMGRGNLYESMEDVRTLAKYKVARGIRRGRRVVAPRVERFIARPLAWAESASYRGDIRFQRWLRQRTRKIGIPA